MTRTDEPIYAYWYRGADNFGDLLTPLVLKAVLDRPVHWTDDWPLVDIVSIGSVLHHLDPRSFRGVVWGSGCISSTACPGSKLSRTATVTLLRGDLSKRSLGISENLPLGDPGLLVDRLYQPSPTRSDGVFVPHYADEGVVPRSWATRLGLKKLDVSGDPITFLKDLGGASYVVSSALHPIVAAHALGIPAVHLRLSDGVMGGDFKFHDYQSAFSDFALVSQDVGDLEDLARACELARSAQVPETEHVKETILTSLPETVGSRSGFMARLMQLVAERRHERGQR